MPRQTYNRCSRSEDRFMAFSETLKRIGRGGALAAVFVAAAAVTAPQPAHALSPGAAVGIGLGSFALGTAIGSGAAAAPYYNPYYAPYYAAPPAYYPPPAAYYPPSRSCWDPYYRRY